jgi:hypothetical protein
MYLLIPLLTMSSIPNKIYNNAGVVYTHCLIHRDALAAKKIFF